MGPTLLSCKEIAGLHARKLRTFMKESFIFKVNARGKDMASARLIFPPIITL